MSRYTEYYIASLTFVHHLQRELLHKLSEEAEDLTLHTLRHLALVVGLQKPVVVRVPLEVERRITEDA